MSLQFCLSQQHNKTPFTFEATGIRVYTFEEVLYHVYHHWRESVDEFLCEEMLQWVAEQGHSYIAAKMKELAKKEPLTERITSFLRLTEYFNAAELEKLHEDLEKWEMRRDWEKLKELGDSFAAKRDHAKAIATYRRALKFDENAAILNNLGLQYMQTGQAKDGLAALTRALTLAPDNQQILLNYIEAAILNGSYKKAAKHIQKAYRVNPANPDIAYLLGLMAYEQKDYPAALTYLEKAIAADPSVAAYTLQSADTHLQMRQYEKALQTLELCPARTAAHFAKEAEIYAAHNDISRAIRAMKEALALEPDAQNYAKLAAYYRMDYEPRPAEEAIAQALALDPENNAVRMENARIKKGLGKTRDYQAELNAVLKSFKDSYRKQY